MKNIWDLALWLLLLWRICSCQGQSSSYYRRTYYNAAVPSARYLYSNHRSSSSIYPGDLVTQESKRKDKSNKPYSKKIPFRSYVSEEDDGSQEQYLSSAEYSNESRGYNSNSNEHDSREIAIGTQIRVQHPISTPKKGHYSTSPKKPQKYPETSSFRATDTPKKPRTPNYASFYEADPFHVVPPPKSTAPSQALSGHPYSVYEDEQDTYVPKSRSKLNNYDRYKSVPSKKQIEKYLEDQEKYLDEAVKSELRNNPKYKKYLQNDDERESEFYDTEYQAKPPPAFRGNFNDNFHQFKSNRPRRRPPAAELKRSPKRPPPNRKYRSAIVINV